MMPAPTLHAEDRHEPTDGETAGLSAKGHRAFSLRAERWVVCLALLFSLLTLSHFLHDHWYAMDPRPRQFPPPPKPAAPMDYAPNVYRVGMPFVVSVVERVLPFHWSVLLTLLDVVFGFVGLFALYLALVDRLPTSAGAGRVRGPLVASFLAAMALPLNWVVPWARPETLPSTCFLALSTLCLLRLRRGPVFLAQLLVLTLLQALTRSDVAAAFGIAILLTALLGRAHTAFGTRRSLMVAGGGVFGTAAATQAYLQLVAFPHAVYPPKTPMYMLPYNFTAHTLNVSLLAVGPFLVGLAAGFVRRQHWQGTDVLAMAAAGVYLPIWFLVGSTTEVRIFVPFLLLLTLPVARVIASALLANDGSAFDSAANQA